MKLLATVFLAISMVSLQVAADNKCIPNPCYLDQIKSECKPGHPCYPTIATYKVCPWKCGEKPPAKCFERCKPCKAEICPAICICELACPLK
ncbi:hypothetical protein GGI19_006811 [Coemansia pectinata]|uniref:Uncharacterized protein n=1 Tax=Coemansia pectinata TaxID=1052879 RepID=A0A9W8L891_9FUNG|nr:hypothetical protein GGI19_006811 [Coemansia pectinata]